MKNKQNLGEILKMGETIWNFGYAQIDKTKEKPDKMIDWTKTTPMEGVLGVFLRRSAAGRLLGKMDSYQEDLLVDQGWLLTVLEARQSAGLTDDQIRHHLQDYQNRSLIAQLHREMKGVTRIGAENPYECILMSATADLAYMNTYQRPIAQEERDLAAFLFAYDSDKIRAMGEHIAEAFLHGFISQSRDRRGRRRVRFFYQIGQEPLAAATLVALKERGLTPVVTEPQSILDTSQFAMDHAQDQAAFYNAKAQASFMENYQAIADQYAPLLSDTCGMIGIGQFGEEASRRAPGKNAYQPTETELEWMEARSHLRRRVEGKYLKPSELSFCKVTFPNLMVGEAFSTIFDDFYELNMEESKPFELIQQVIIDCLDTCRSVKIKGRKGNQTNLTVSLAELQDAHGQTKFLNCGGDLNIPYGELFTTPRLQGTHGLYHVSEIYLRKMGYQDLLLEFQDGKIVDYRCKNTGKKQADRDYIRKNLFGNQQELTMGEFAIGSNTRAFAIAKKHKLIAKLPILLVEKMGPHIAIGDPCFARGEDAPIYNLYDKKEMVARENERTACRFDQGDSVYFNRHIDITLPYNEIGTLSGLKENGEEITIIHNGRFVLPGTEKLNQPLIKLENQEG